MLSFFRRSILTRLWLVFGVLYALSVLFVAWLLFINQEGAIIESAAKESTHRSELALQEIEARLFGAQRDINLLATSPSLIKFVEQANAKSEDDLAALFSSYLSTREEYFQVRFIEANSGKEILRLDKKDGNNLRAASTELQIKKEREYFKETVKLGAGDFYFSEISLNREYDQISIPEIKTLRAARPIYGEQNELVGIVVININLESWLNVIASLSGEESMILMQKENGDFLIHPNDSLCLGLDKGQASNHAESLITETGSEGLKAYSNGSFFENRVMFTQDELTYNEVPKRLIKVIDFTPYEALFTSVVESRRQIVAASIIVLAIGLFLIFILSKRLTKPLIRMESQIAKFQSDEGINLTDSERSDEFGSLAQSFERLGAQLQNEAQIAKNASDEKEEFLASFSHELRTPLNSILGMTEVLSENDPKPEQKPVLKTLNYAVQNLRALIGDVLDSAKISQGELELRSENLVLAELAQNLILSHNQEARRKSLELSYSIEDKLPKLIQSDYLRLYQILNNLLSNAVKFTSEGYVKLSILKRNEQILFQVEDSGAGISEADQELIFEKFKQSQAGKISSQGLGLGLSISKKLCELFGSELKIESELDKGSSFFFQIPLNEAQETESLGAKTQQKLTKILYVDDIAINRFTLIQLLKGHPYHVLEASSCKEAMTVIKTENVPIIIMDLRMPEIDGFECIKRLSKTELAFIALSANLGDVEKAKLAGLNVNFAIEKPIQKSELLKSINSILKDKSLIFAQLGEYFNTDDLGELEKPLELMIEALNASIEELNEAELGEQALSDFKHKIRPSLLMINQGAILDLEAHDLKHRLMALIEQLESAFKETYRSS